MTHTSGARMESRQISTLVFYPTREEAVASVVDTLGNLLNASLSIMITPVGKSEGFYVNTVTTVSLEDIGTESF